MQTDSKYHGKFVGNINQPTTVIGPKDADLDFFSAYNGKKGLLYHQVR